METVPEGGLSGSMLGDSPLGSLAVEKGDSLNVGGDPPTPPLESTPLALKFTGIFPASTDVGDGPQRLEREKGCDEGAAEVYRPN